MLYNNLSISIHNRRESALREMRHYSRFDRECQLKLKAFSLVLLKLGQFKKERALTLWYNNTLKPVDTFYQNLNIAGKIANERVMLKVFGAWRN